LFEQETSTQTTVGRVNLQIGQANRKKGQKKIHPQEVMVRVQMKRMVVPVWTLANGGVFSVALLSLLPEFLLVSRRL